MSGEGITITHKEWDFIRPFLEVCPLSLSEFLLAGTPSTMIDPILVSLIDRLLSHRPASDQIQVCNKLLPLLQSSTSATHKQISTKAKELHEEINKKRDEVYERLWPQFDAAENLLLQIRVLIQQTANKAVTPNQTALTGRPQWYETYDRDSRAITAKLLLNNPNLIDFSQIYTMVQQTIRKVKPGPTQSQIIAKLTNTYSAENILILIAV